MPVWRAVAVPSQAAMDLADFQTQMRALYGDRDRGRGLARTFAWFTEECGELSRALFRGTPADREHEFADVLAWLASLADQAGVDLARAARRYANGCPRCGSAPCACDRPGAG
ncbi:MazG nucleotide pyrophosphohydrolase domain-containing protein [soil metagenome]|jgi:NTP pyrophosphatase (non-canonical NTP hydrolase)